MKCLFCPTLEMPPANGVRIITCPQCSCAYWLEDDVIFRWEYKSIYKEHVFLVQWRARINITAIIKLNVRGTTSYIKDFSGEVLTITPHNIQQKLPFILTFL
jgi:hypothetical protein